jgi:nucleoside-diphosphate-sugar epimerase
MTIIITGATGLVGARLLPRLVAAGHECRALLRAGRVPPAGTVCVQGDLLDPASLGDALKGADAIIHLAAVFRTGDAGLIWKSNLEGTRNLIAAAQAHAPDARLIMASTTLVYDRTSPRPGEESDTVSPTMAYPASKAAAEEALRESGLNWCIQRFGFVYGDGDGHLESLPALAAGGRWHPAQRMSMIHHRDIAAIMSLALEGRMDGKIINVVDDAPTTIYELVTLAGGSIEPSSEPLDNPWFTHADGSLARRLGFQPSVRTVHEAVAENLL